MNIAILGSGMIGGTLARHFIAAGHTVALANSRGPESLGPLAAELGAALLPMTKEAAAAFGEVVVLATPWRQSEALPSPEAVEGKIVVDAMNPYAPDFTLYALDRPSSVLTAERLPGARLVKAFNSIWFKHLQEEARKDTPVEERRVIPLSGDDAEAKRVVAGLVEQIGFGPLDIGTLADSRRQEPNQPFYNKSIPLAEAKALL